MIGAGRIGREQLAPLLEFVSPGILHSLGNQLFAIQGNAQVLGIKEEDIARERSAILSAAKAAQESLDILRCLTGDNTDSEKAQVGVLLRRVCEACKVPLREAGLRCVIEHSSVETPVHVARGSFTRCLLEIMRCIREELPGGFDGDLHVDLSSQQARYCELCLEVQQKPSLLPFPLSIDAVQARAKPLVSAHGASLQSKEAEGRLCLHLPLSSE
ncbi:MAG: hypothetical protein ACYTG5_02730 [Planctomycetota bacterium]|jgi:hypothetical protein